MTTTAADLTPEYLTAALRDHLRGASVVAVTTEVVGAGQMGDCVRVTPDYDRPGAGPATLVAKLPSTDATSRATAAALRAYEIEVNFYRELHAGLQVRAPRCYHAAIDVETSDFTLLLEDVAPARQGDQLAGCTPDEAAAAVAELPGLHAPRWGDDRLAKLDWLHRNTVEAKGTIPELVRSLWPGFVERYAERMDPEILAVAERLIDQLHVYDGNRPGPWTVTHGDYRLDNLLFTDATDRPGGGRPVVVDWQTAVYGPGVSDLSYFLGSGLLPGERAAHEADLVRSYHQAMRAAGVDLGWEDLWAQYRRYSFGGLVMAIAASMLVQRTERGDDMFMTMAHRHGRHAIEMDAVDLLA
ncbi:ecdysteroid 22-kinase family protein [Acidiferrimicrobium sp. IK]|uniref:ecdysteroid 22-kinase family protein n=1 Tax=Acidiferrimicrobium sp. IK TaxID=2871700 RepID=UPI0021CB5D91|nr:ecdysteroid 22-kinase family protein [Acidiferrimicrobium sp. IK]MCU4186809.1 ecdysteroid 22-kinase family protein [Acidiferrimicrobium sp. IK]